MKLVAPSHLYKESYLSHVAEFREREEPLIPFPISFPTDNFSAFLKRLEDASKGNNLTNGFVANSTYWLVENEEVLAVSNLRHELNDRLREEGGHIGYGVRPSKRKQGVGSILLELTLKEAKRKGINRVLVTCDADNTASIGVILKNGGIFTEEEILEKIGKHVKRYWIGL